MQSCAWWRRCWIVRCLCWLVEMGGERLEWLSAEKQNRLVCEETDAFCLAAGDGLWIERFGPAVLISSERACDEVCLAEEVFLRANNSPHGVPRAVYLRRLVKVPGCSDRPRLIAGGLEGDCCVARENGLAFKVDFSGGYHVGLFPDQRSNRKFLKDLRPKKLLNLFAFTCAFSVAVASVGGRTLSVDVSRRSLAIGRANFLLNGLSLEGQRMVADDVRDVLPRLVRRGEKYDAIVIDPPTFARVRRGRIFRVKEELEGLIQIAMACAESGGWIIVSTNCSTIGLGYLKKLAGKLVPSGSRVEAVEPPHDYRAGGAARVVRIQMP